MKRSLCLCLCLALAAALLPGCRSLEPEAQAGPALPAADIAAAAAEAAGGAPEGAESLDSAGGEMFPAYVRAAYGIGEDAWEEGALIRGTGAVAFEIAVLRFAGEEQARQGAGQLEAYQLAREGDFTGYAPDQAALVAGGIVRQEGAYAGLFLCQEPGRAEEAFVSALRTGVLPTPGPTAEPDPSPTPGPTPVPAQQRPSAGAEPDPDFPGRIRFDPPCLEDMTLYDTAPILSAWIAGDPAGLSAYDRAIYDAAAAVLESVLTEDMSPVEREEALYTWIAENVVYDWRHADLAERTPRESYTPYGALVDHAAVCLGFASAFQLLADMAGLECITVIGASSSNQSDHAWNMVRLDGEWYCLDVTWDRRRDDDNGAWRYFNITSDEMARSNHQWDYAGVPEATATDRGVPQA